MIEDQKELLRMRNMTEEIQYSVECLEDNMEQPLETRKEKYITKQQNFSWR